MYEKIRLGDKEVVRPLDPEGVKALTSEVLRQNRMILEMNARLLAQLSMTVAYIKNNEVAKDGLDTNRTRPD